MKHVIFSSDGKLLITYVSSTTDLLIVIQMYWHHCHTFLSHTNQVITKTEPIFRHSLN